MANISVRLCGSTLANPAMLASGIVGVSGAALVFAAQHGAGAVVSKSIGPREREGHSNPILVEFEGGFLNAVGLPNSGVENSISEIAYAVTHSPSPVVASIFGGTKEEFGLVAERISEARPALIEANLSCPNTVSDLGLPFALSEKDAREVIEIVKDSTRIPVIAKLAPNVPDIRAIARAVAGAGADAISAINTMPGMVIDARARRPVLHNREGGVSGHALKPVALRCVYEIYEAVDVPVIGIGGITNGTDIAEFVMAGATAVQIGTGVYYRGIDIFNHASEELQAFLAAEQCSLTSLRGAAHR